MSSTDNSAIMLILFLPLIGSANAEILPSTGIQYYCDPEVNCPVYHAPTINDKIWELMTNPVALALLLVLAYVLFHTGCIIYDAVIESRKKSNDITSTREARK